jgi:hypothetical protein
MARKSVPMDVLEKFVQLCGEVGNYTKKLTGVSIVDAYFGPAELSPENQKKDTSANDLILDLESLTDAIQGNIRDPLKQNCLLGEVSSLIAVVNWLNGSISSYSDIVEQIFHIEMKKYPKSEIKKRRIQVDEVLTEYPGETLNEKVKQFESEGEITGDKFRELVEGELQNKANDVGLLFKEKVYSILGTDVTDNGVEYKCVHDKPWAGYNWYQGDYKSINEFNTDVTFNKDSILGVIYHEYEHHVSNLWRERSYIEDGNLDLAIVPLHTGRCVISEGTADTARDFLGVMDDSPRMVVVNALYNLRRMTGINAAIMLNKEKKHPDEVVDYLVERGLRKRKSAEQSIAFIRPSNKDGKPNIWAPYVFTYNIGRTEFVLPTFQRAAERDALPEFFRTLYLNPYSGSSVTWESAFEWL